MKYPPSGGKKGCIVEVKLAGTAQIHNMGIQAVGEICEEMIRSLLCHACSTTVAFHRHQW